MSKKLNFFENIFVGLLKIFGNLKFRSKVAAIVLDDGGRFLIVQIVTYEEDQWSFPGGGKEVGETEEQALHRELKEELNLFQFNILKRSQETIQYAWPNFTIWQRFKKDNKIWKGQEVRYFLIKYNGKKLNLKINRKEIRKIKWIKREDFVKYFIFSGQLDELNIILGNFNV